MLNASFFIVFTKESRNFERRLTWLMTIDGIISELTNDFNNSKNQNNYGKR